MNRTQFEARKASFVALIKNVCDLAEKRISAIDDRIMKHREALMASEDTQFIERMGEKIKKEEEKRERAVENLRNVNLIRMELSALPTEWQHDCDPGSQFKPWIWLTVARDDLTKWSYPKVWDERYDYDKRMMARPSYFFKKKFPIEWEVLGITKDMGQSFMELYGEACARERGYSHRIVHGDDLVEVYNNDKLHSSCMSNTRYIFAYRDNPETVGLLVVSNKKKEDIARALIWETDQGVTVVDRIYPNDTPALSYIYTICDGNGWDYRVSQSFSGNDTSLVWTNRKDEGYTVRMHLDDKFPYMDSFCYVDEDRDDVDDNGRNILYDRFTRPYRRRQMTCQYGSNPWYPRVECYSCDEMFDQDETTDIDGEETWICGSCLEEYYEQYEGDWYHSDEMCTTWDDDRVPTELATYSSFYDAYVLDSEMLTIRRPSDVNWRQYTTCIVSENDDCELVDLYDQFGSNTHSCALEEDCQEVRLKSGKMVYVFESHAIETDDGEWILENDSIETHDGCIYAKWECLPLSDGYYTFEDAQEVIEQPGPGGKWCMGRLLAWG